MEFPGLGAGGGVMPQMAQPQGAPPQAQLTSAIEQLRQLDQMATDLQAQMPGLAQDVAQIKAIIKRMVVRAAQAGQQDTASAMALPVGG